MRQHYLVQFEDGTFDIAVLVNGKVICQSTTNQPIHISKIIANSEGLALESLIL